MSGRRNIVVLFLIMAAVAVTIAGVSIWVLYEAAFAQQREQLIDRVQQQARMLESEVRFELARSGSGRLGKSGAPTLEQILLVQMTHTGFGKTGQCLTSAPLGQIELIA